jgi:two-component system, cell cycle sensor histidine kinase and response regulator CckA
LCFFAHQKNQVKWGIGFMNAYRRDEKHQGLRRNHFVVILFLLLLFPAMINTTQAAGLHLSPEERAWLDDNPEKLVLFFNTEFPPIEFISDTGAFIGMGADIVSTVERLLQVTFVKKPLDDWNAHLAALKSGECAIAPTIVRTPDREEYAFFTTPYATVPVVIITTPTTTNRMSLNDFGNRRIGVVSGFATEQYLADQALLCGFELVPVANVPEGLQKVSFGQIDAFVENLAVAAYYIEQKGIPNLQVAGMTDYAFAWSMGISREYPLLYSAIQKALDAIPENDLAKIRERWISLQADLGLSPETARFLKMLFLFITLLLLGFAAISFLLKYRLRQTIAELRESKEKYKHLAENSPAVVYQFKMTPEGEFLLSYINEPHLLKKDANSDDERRGSSALLNLIHPEDMQAFQESVQASASSLDRYQAVFRYLKDGEVRWFEARSMPERLDDGGILWNGFLIDVTKRKRAEEALKLSETTYREIFNAVNESIFIHDAETGAILDVNKTTLDMFGYSQDEIKAITVGDISAGDPHSSQEKAFSFIQKAASGEVQQFEWHCKRKDGSFFWAEASLKRGLIAGKEVVMAIGHDITGRKQAERELLESHRMLRDVIETIPVRVFWKDRAGRYLGCNNLFAQDAGWKHPKDLIGEDDYSMGWRDQAEQYRADDLAVIERDAPKINYEEHQTAPDGRRIWLRTSKIPLRDDEGDIYGILGVYEDITEAKRAEEEKERLQDQLYQAQKMESVGRLAGGVAHDFNNMLSVILGHTELAMEKMPPEQPLYSDLEEIRQAAARSADLTRQLLAYARKQTVAPKVIDLNETVEGMLKMLRRLIGEDIDLAWFPGTKPGPVNMDPSQLDQILVNLCVNARDAIGDTGKITIETKAALFDEAYCALHAGFIPGDYVQLTVSDNGHGMDKMTLGKLFEPFFTTKEIGKGTGLGLATVYGIVKQNNGFINVYSEPGKGTTFHIYLPRHHRNVELAPRDSYRKPVSTDGHETILLVEDEPAILKMALTMLKRQGYNVLAAATPGEAIRIAGEHPGEIHLLMTDVVMPEMNGRDLAKKLLSLHPDIKRLFMSGYTANVIAHHGVLDDGVHFIQKPFSMNELIAKVREALEIQDEIISDD